jgi:PHD/YefM family antitoxin component YafN of YafNO toxin-antitoxin module
LVLYVELTGNFMLAIDHIDSLSSFQRNTKTHLAKLRRTGRPEILTINGKAELIVQDAQAYQAMLERIDELEAMAGIKEGIASAKAGKGRKASTFLADMREKHGIREAV